MVTEHYNMIYEYTRDIMGLCKNIHEILAYKVFCRYSIDIPGIPKFWLGRCFLFFWPCGQCRGLVMPWVCCFLGSDKVERETTKTWHMQDAFPCHCRSCGWASLACLRECINFIHFLKFKTWLIWWIYSSSFARQQPHLYMFSWLVEKVEISWSGWFWMTQWWFSGWFHPTHFLQIAPLEGRMLTCEEVLHWSRIDFDQPRWWDDPINN